ncbi:MAG: hypothetical protein BMS9Abin29_0189 [Gemmatimonadota bacterium]|nr:MAG: hypothetical protein BMS9Abin29_0189 [Gemmatimonadota bacterium]
MPHPSDVHFDGGSPGPLDPARAVGTAVQRTVASTLGRGFVPLMALGLTGLVEGLRGRLFATEVVALVLGSLLTAAAMLAYGQLAVHKAFGRPKHAWAGLASMGGMVPYVFGVYVVVGFGLMPLRGGVGLGRLVATLFFVAMGSWCLRSQWRLTDLHLFVRSISEPAAVVGGQDAAAG